MSKSKNLPSKRFCPYLLTLKLTLMFDFEKLEVYLKAKSYNKNICKFLEDKKIDKNINDQLKRGIKQNCWGVVKEINPNPLKRGYNNF
jgi:hypothetical protein